MIESRDDCKAVVQKIDKYEVHLKGDNCYRSAKTLPEAQKIAKVMESEALAEFEKKNSEDTKRRDSLEFLEQNIGEYVKLLSQRLWDLQHSKSYSTTVEDANMEKETLKGIIKNLNGFLNGSLYVHKGMRIYAKDREEYYIQTIKEDD